MHEKRKTAGRRNRPGPRGCPKAAQPLASGCPAPAGRSGVVTLARASQRSAWASQGEDAEAVSTARPSTAPAHSPGSTTGWDRQWNIGAGWRSTLRGNTGPAASTMRSGVPSKTLGVPRHKTERHKLLFLSRRWQSATPLLGNGAPPTWPAALHQPGGARLFRASCRIWAFSAR